MMIKSAAEYIKVLTGGDLDAAARAMKDILSDDRFVWFESYGWKSIAFSREYVHDNYNWSHGIEGIHLNNEGVVSIDIYWQGDKTDGSISMKLWDALSGNNRIGGKWYDDGRTERYPITVERKELSAMFKEVARLLSDEEIQRRKDGRMRQTVSDRVFPEFYRRFEAGIFGGNTRAHNGYKAVCALVDEEWRRLKDLSEDELWKAVVTVRNQNYLFNHELTQVDGKIKYNLNF